MLHKIIKIKFKILKKTRIIKLMFNYKMIFKNFKIHFRVNKLKYLYKFN